MDEFLVLIVSNPFADVQILLSIAGAVAFLIFAWGFTGFILAHEDAEHQETATRRMLVSLVWMVALFVLWLLVRWLAGLLY